MPSNPAPCPAPRVHLTTCVHLATCVHRGLLRSRPRAWPGGTAAGVLRNRAAAHLQSLQYDRQLYTCDRPWTTTTVCQLPTLSAPWALMEAVISVPRRPAAALTMQDHILCRRWVEHKV